MAGGRELLRSSTMNSVFHAWFLIACAFAPSASAVCLASLRFPGTPFLLHVYVFYFVFCFSVPRCLNFALTRLSCTLFSFFFLPLLISLYIPVLYYIAITCRSRQAPSAMRRPCALASQRQCWRGRVGSRTGSSPCCGGSGHGGSRCGERAR